MMVNAGQPLTTALSPSEGENEEAHTAALSRDAATQEDAQ